MPPHVLGDDFDRCCNRFAGDNPFGEDVKYDPAFESLQAAIQKAGVSAAGGETDWKSVKLLGIEILSGRSKDLSVASYLTFALFQLDGYGGLADGIGILHKYVRDDWDGIFPTRPKARASALEWLTLPERLPSYIEWKAPAPSEAPLLRSLKEEIEAFQKTVAERMPVTFSFHVLANALANHLQSLPAEGGGDATAPQVTSEPLQSAGPSSPAEPEVTPGTPAAEIETRIRALIPPLRQADPLSPVPYRLLRSLKWETVAAPPPLDPNSANPGTTRIPPPRPQQRTVLENLYASGNWAELLRASEAAFQDGAGTFWLDLQRYTAAALEGLDSGAGARAAEAVKEETSRLLNRLKTLSTLYFTDRTVTNPVKPTERTVERTPFASEETRGWLESLQSAAAGAPQPGALFLPPEARTTDTGEPALSPADAQAVQELLARQDLRAAFDVLQDAVDKATGPRSRFRTRLAAARLCLQTNQAAWARALLDELLRESESFHFEDWEPELAADIYQLLAVCYSRPAKKGGPQDAEAARVQIENFRRRLFRLDMRAAAVLEEALRR